MASLGLWTVRVLRKLPITPAFDAHLSRCALAAIWYDERLTVAKVFGWTAVESVESQVDFGDEAVEAAMLARRFAEDKGRGVVNETVNFQHGTKTLQ